MILYFVLVLVPNRHWRTAFDCLPRKMRTKGMHTNKGMRTNARIYNFFEIKDSLNTIQGFSEESFAMQLGA